MYMFDLLIIGLFLNPLTCIHKGIYPRSSLIVASCIRIICALPGEDRALEVGHHCEVATVVGADACYRRTRSVGVAGISAVVVACHDVVAVERHRQVELPRDPLGLAG